MDGAWILRNSFVERMLCALLHICRQRQTGLGLKLRFQAKSWSFESRPARRLRRISSPLVLQSLFFSSFQKFAVPTRSTRFVNNCHYSTSNRTVVITNHKLRIGCVRYEPIPNPLHPALSPKGGEGLSDRRILDPGRRGAYGHYWTSCKNGHLSLQDGNPVTRTTDVF